MSTYESRVLDSLHEAGHAVVCIAQGGTVEYVTTVEAVCDSPGPWERAVTCFAGAIAARRLGPKHRDTSRWYSDKDEAVAKAALEDCGGIRVFAIEEAERLVRLNDSGIIRVAGALREHGRLDHAGVVAAIEGRRSAYSAGGGRSMAIASRGAASPYPGGAKAGGARTSRHNSSAAALRWRDVGGMYLVDHGPA